MNTLSQWLTSARDWLDARGRPAWIVAMILGFIFFWPVGLFLLFYMIGSKRMRCTKRWENRTHKFHAPTTGNSAFDNYRDETLKRLEEEQNAFQSFVQRLREAKDKSEFDQFMDDRSKMPSTNDGEPA